MTEKKRINLRAAEAIADEIRGILASSCERIDIAGSIRRKRESVGDVEIVCVPILQATGLFGDGTPIDLVSKTCDNLIATGRLAHRLDKNGRKSYGQKFKRMLFDGFALDLFSVLDPAQFGVIFAIRTGPAEFSKRLVTQKAWGGMMPQGFRVSDGHLWDGSGEMIPCRSEGDLFKAIGVEFIAPEKRA